MYRSGVQVCLGILVLWIRFVVPSNNNVTSTLIQCILGAGHWCILYSIQHALIHIPVAGRYRRRHYLCHIYR
jgi:hypothetical protein